MQALQATLETSSRSCNSPKGSEMRIPQQRQIMLPLAHRKPPLCTLQSKRLSVGQHDSGCACIVTNPAIDVSAYAWVIQHSFNVHTRLEVSVEGGPRFEEHIKGMSILRLLASHSTLVGQQPKQAQGKDTQRHRSCLFLCTLQAIM